MNIFAPFGFAREFRAQGFKVFGVWGVPSKHKILAGSQRRPC